MSRNAVKHGTSESELVAAAVEAVRSALPGTWRIALHREPRRLVGQRVFELDAEVVVEAPDGSSAVVPVEFKRAVVPRDVDRIAKRVAAYNDQAKGAMLVAPFVSPATRALLEQHGMSWFDATGNFRLVLDGPAVFIDRSGADRSEFRDPGEGLLKSLRGPAAARVVLALCEVTTPVGVREVAALAGVGVATSSRVLDLLDREAVIRRLRDGTVDEVRRRGMVTRWAADYRVLKSNDVISALDPRGLEHALSALPALGREAVVTGSAGARAYLPPNVVPVSPMASLSVYAEDPIGLVERLRLKPVERGANVLVLRAYDDVVHERARVVDGLRVAPPAQVVADLLTGPGRSGEEAEQLLQVLESVERGWTS